MATPDRRNSLFWNGKASRPIRKLAWAMGVGVLVVTCFDARAFLAAPGVTRAVEVAVLASGAWQFLSIARYGRLGGRRRRRRDRPLRQIGDAKE